jgi:hypothetical protein
LALCNYGTLQLWQFAKLAFRNFGTLQLWHFETLNL